MSALHAMIRIVLLGRTGNNLFQYALGRALSKKHGVPLVMDGSWFNKEGWREVSHFLKLPLQATIVRRCSLGARLLRKLTGKHYWEFSRLPVIREAPECHAFDAQHLDAPDDCLLIGYFQTQLYFESIADELRGEIKGLLENSVSAPEPLKSSLTSPSSIAIHVRRGDFLAQQAFHVCDLDYYIKAMNETRERISDARFFLFSDEPAWCRVAFPAPDIEVIDSGFSAANPLHDLYLMSCASHHIISNSSYSWWAAWLGKKNGQHVITPPRWFSKDITAPISEKLCPGWSVVGTKFRPDPA